MANSVCEKTDGGLEIITGRCEMVRSMKTWDGVIRRNAMGDVARKWTSLFANTCALAVSGNDDASLFTEDGPADDGDSVVVV